MHELAIDNRQWAIDMNGALSGIRVLDFSEYIAGPYAGQMLADMGAEVIKVEPPHGDFWRHTSPVAPFESRGFIGVNRGKRSVSLDLKRPESADIIARAIKSADVFLANYRPGVAARLGVDYETLSAINPRLIYCENTAFGTRGPYREKPGFDLVAQAMTGIMSFEGAGGMPHPIITTSPTDLSAGMFMAFAIASALYQREHTGRGQHIETSLFAAGIAIQYRPMFSIEKIDHDRREALLSSLREGRAAGRRDEEALERTGHVGDELRRLNPYYKIYETRDSYIALACLNNRLRRRACDALEIEDPRVAGDQFAPLALDLDEAESLGEHIKAIFMTRSTDDWVELLTRNGVPCGPVKLTAELFDDPHVQAEEIMLEFDHPVVGPVRMANSPLRMSDAETGARASSPTLGQHTREFLAELGYSREQVASFEESGVARTWQP
jgi:formyl-CoA transferase